MEILNCRLFRIMVQHFVTLEKLRFNKPPLLKLRAAKLLVSFHHFCISGVNKVQTKIAVTLKIHFSESYYKTKSTVDVWNGGALIQTFLAKLHEKVLLSANIFQVNNFPTFNLTKTYYERKYFGHNKWTVENVILAFLIFLFFKF